MTTTEPARPPLAGIRLAPRIALAKASTWGLARMGDPVARLLEAPWRDAPYPLYAALRRQGPLVRSRTGMWVAGTHAVCEEVLRDRRFGVRRADGSSGDPMSEATGFRLSLLELDPPDHTRLRRLAAPAFRPRGLEQYRQLIEDTTDELLGRAASNGTFDLVRDFATPLPIRVIGKLLGLPPIGGQRLARHGAVLGGALDGIRSFRQLHRMRESAAELESMFGDLIEQRRRRPGEDVVSDLLGALDEQRLDAAELVDLCGLLLVAGFETTVNLIGNGTLALLEHPEQWERLRDEPDLAPAVVDETLRWDAPVQATVRLAHEPLELAGRQLPTNAMVLLLLGSAGRDPAVHHDPERFDIARPTRAEHLAFSSGIHYCLGAPLARMESEVAFRRLATRLPGLRRAGAAVRRPSTIIHGLASLPVATGEVQRHTL